MPESRQLQVDGISVELVRKRIKNLNLSVRGSEGAVRVSAPLRVNEAEIRAFVASRKDWIRKHQSRLAAMPGTQQPGYVPGELHYFQGRPYRLQTCVFGPSGLQVNGEAVLRLSVSPDAGAEQIRASLQTWYREQLARLIPPLVAQYEPRMGVKVAQWRIRRMKTRWGSCNIKKRRIWINLELAKWPPQCLEYIVVHEMVHLLERGHNARFYGFMDAFLPTWREAESRLREVLIA